ncbi:MAG: hypothetical protein JWM62_285 [Frankiales bacterium]|nr:hypothetical protein [Frankiales bacterium]
MTDLLAIACLALAAVSAFAVLGGARDLRLGGRVLLDLLLAAGLVHLTGAPDWRDVAVVGVLVLARVVAR